jgi:hypothetical protein
MSKVYNALIQRFIEWNLAEAGQDHGRYQDWSYKEFRFFNQHYPIARIVTTAAGEKVRLVKAGSGNSWMGGKLTFFGNAFHTYYVPDIGVFSPYEGDYLPEPDMHRRQGYIMLQQVRCFAEDKLDTMNGKKLQERNVASNLQGALQRLYERFDKYSQLFNLGWDPLPIMYQSELAGEIDRMIRIYNNPKMVQKRERAAARKLAKKTLGLD